MIALIILTSFNTAILVSFSLLLALALKEKIDLKGARNGNYKKTFTKAKNKKLWDKQGL